jgi:hypothetical protein
MFDLTCKICALACGDEAELLKHLRTHKISQAEYFQKHYPRYDKLDGGIIRFKSRDFYFNAEFNSRANFATWIRRASQDEAKSYIRAFLMNRKERKGLIYAPTQVELRTLMVPGMGFISKLFGDYYAFTESLGLKRRFDHYSWSKMPNLSRKDHYIAIDTREQMPLTFSSPTARECLPFGDYRMNDGAFTHECYIERKSCNDFYGTLSNGYERFSREIDRCVAAGAYMVVVVECDIDAVIKFPNSAQVAGKMRISPEFVFRNMRTLLQKYSNLQFLFVKDRACAAKAIQRIFRSGGEFKGIDLQYAMDTGKLI